MKIIITLLLNLVISFAYAENITDKKQELSGTVLKQNVSIEIREEMVAKKEIQLIQVEKDIQQKAKFLEEAREQLVTEAINARNALDNREKEIKKKEEQSKVKLKKQPASTKSLTDLIEEINTKHPVKK